MLSIMYWNIGNNDLTVNVARLARTYNLDIIILDESQIAPGSLLFEINSPRAVYEHVPQLGCDRFYLFVRFPKAHISTRFEADRMSIHEVQIPGRLAFLLSIVHLPAKQNSSSSSQAMDCVRYADWITQTEIATKHKRTVLVGDLNMNPFEDGMVAASGFHATMCRSIANTRSRTVRGRRYEFFYNPMWSLLGDYPQGPPGTHYYKRSDTVELFWNMYDQVLIRPELISCFDNSSLKILTTDGIDSLISSKGIPLKERLSDHLPIIFSLNI